MALRLAGIAVVATMVWHWRHAAFGADLAGGLHTLFYSGLLIVFARSVLPGRMPLITALVLRVEPGASPARIRYTGRATLAWAIFFAGQLIVSATLFACASRAAWFHFITLWNAPLVAAMFLAEFAFRLWWFHGQERVSMRDTWAAVRGR